MKRFCGFLVLSLLLLTPAFAQQGHSPEGASAGEAAGHAENTSSGGEHGEGGHGALGGENATLWKTANFVILVGLLIYLLRGKVGPFFAEHNKGIARSMASASAKAEEAKARLDAMEARLANLDHEIAGLREHAALEMERDRERIQQETTAAIQRLQERAQGEIRSATAHAQAKLRHQAATLALELAEKQVRAEAGSAEMQDRLLRQAVERLGGAQRN